MKEPKRETPAQPASFKKQLYRRTGIYSSGNKERRKDPSIHITYRTRTLLPSRRSAAASTNPPVVPALVATTTTKAAARVGRASLLVARKKTKKRRRCRCRTTTAATPSSSPFLSRSSSPCWTKTPFLSIQLQYLLAILASFVLVVLRSSYCSTQHPTFGYFFLFLSPPSLPLVVVVVVVALVAVDCL